MYLLFDIGGTNMRFALSRDGETFSEPEILSTPADFGTAMETIQMIANRLCQDEKIKGVVGGIAGTLSASRTSLSYSPHLAGWLDQPLGESLTRSFDCPVIIENDTAMVGLGEATAGAGQGSAILTYLTISTGVGGVRIVNGQIDRYTSGFEPGQQIIDYKNPSRYFEDYVSGTAVARDAGRAPREIAEPEFWQELAKVVAVGIHNTIVHWSPDRIVLGGSMMKVPGLAIADLENELKQISRVFKPLPQLVHASLGDIGGLHGALALARQKIPLTK
jgi:predicted NBD/HSP70 family sugar kinase